MATITKFEDLECWKAARILTKEIYKATSEGRISKDYGLRDQIRRASLSIMNNVAEGFGRFSKKEFKRFLDIAQSSAAEVQSMVYVIEDLGYLTKIQVKDLQQKTSKARALCRGLIKYLDKK